MQQETRPSELQDYQFRVVHAVKRHLVPGAQALVLIDDAFGRQVRSALMQTRVLSCSDDDLYTAVLQADPGPFHELHPGSLIQFRLEHVLDAVSGGSLEA